MAINPSMIFANAGIDKQLAGAGIPGAGDLPMRLAAMANAAGGPQVMPPAPQGLVADPNAPPGIQTLGAPVPGVPPVAPTAIADPRMARPNFGSYVPQGLVQMLMRLQAGNPDRLAQLFGRQPGFMDRFGITPETDFANMYTRQMARQDFRGGQDPMAAGTILTPEQRAGYPAMRQWPQYAGGGMGNMAPAQPGGGQGFQRPMGMAERKAPGSQSSGY